MGFVKTLVVDALDRGIPVLACTVGTIYGARRTGSVKGMATWGALGWGAGSVAGMVIMRVLERSPTKMPTKITALPNAPISSPTVQQAVGAAVQAGGTIAGVERYDSSKVPTPRPEESSDQNTVRVQGSMDASAFGSMGG